MKQILFIMPFGEKTFPSEKNGGQPITIDFDKKYDQIKTKINNLNLDLNVNRVNNIIGGGDIYKNMYKSINAADIVLADLTSLNPNVMYELGARHALRDKKTILFQQNEGMNKYIPFDITTFKVWKVSDLIKNFEKIIQNDDFDSPIKKEIQSNHTSDKDVFENYTNTWNAFDHKYNESSNLQERSFALEEYKKSFEGIEEFDQKYALNHYKLNEDLEGLQKSLSIIQKHNPNISIDHETIGLACSISRKIYEITNNSSDEMISFNFSRHFISIYKTNYSYSSYALNLIAKMEKEIKNPNGSKDIHIYYKEEVRLLLEDFNTHCISSSEPEYFWSTKSLIEALSGIQPDLSKIKDTVFVLETSKKACDRAYSLWYNFLNKRGNGV